MMKVAIILNMMMAVVEELPLEAGNVQKAVNLKCRYDVWCVSYS